MDQVKQSDFSNNYKQLELSFGDDDKEKKNIQALEEQQGEDELIELITLQSDITPLISLLQLPDVEVISKLLRNHFTGWSTVKATSMAKSLLTHKAIKSMLASCRKGEKSTTSEELTKIILATIQQIRYRAIF